MKKKFSTFVVTTALSILLLVSLNGCGYNSLTQQDEGTKAAWSEVLNQYQRRADLIPNLVNTVKGYASHEKEVLEGVAQARSNVGKIAITPEMLNDEAALKRFQDAQGQLTGALSKLMAVAEAYPELKADQNFRDLQSQLEGTENRVAVARNRYIETVRAYNSTARSFPTNLIAKVFGFQTKANFTVENENAISQAPVVKF